MHERPPASSGLGADDGVEQFVGGVRAGRHVVGAKVGIPVGLVLVPNRPFGVAKHELHAREFLRALAGKLESEHLQRMALLLLRDGAGSRGFRRGQAPEPRDERRLDGNLRHLLRVGGPHRLLWQEPLTRLVPRHAPVHQVVLGVGGEHDAALRRACRAAADVSSAASDSYIRTSSCASLPTGYIRLLIRRDGPFGEGASLAHLSKNVEGLRARWLRRRRREARRRAPGRATRSRYSPTTSGSGSNHPREPRVRPVRRRSRTHDAIVASLAWRSASETSQPSNASASSPGTESGCTCGDCR